MSSRILLVDDDPRVRTLLRIWIALEAGAAEVVEAGNGAEAVAACRDGVPDLVILDRDMPIMDGRRAAIEIRSLAPDARIVGFTSSGRCGEVWADRCYDKGDLEGLLSEIRAA